GFATIMRLEPDQHLNTVFAREARQSVSSVLPDAFDEIVRHADVQRPVTLACQHVDEEAHSLPPIIPAKGIVALVRSSPRTSAKQVFGLRGPSLCHARAPFVRAWIPAFAGMSGV